MAKNQSVIPAWQAPFQADMTAAVAAYHAADYRTAWELCDKQEPIARKHVNTAGVAWVARLRGDILSAQGKHGDALEKFNLAAELFKSVDLKTEYLSVIEARADAELRLGKLREAKADYQRRLDNALLAPVPVDIAAAYRGLATTAYDAGDMLESVQLFDKGLASLPEGKEVDMAADLQARRALVFAALGDTDRAIDQLILCLAHWQEKKHPRWVATTQYQLATVYARRKNVQSTKELALQARQAYEGLKDQDGVVRCDRLLADPQKALRTPMRT